MKISLKVLLILYLLIQILLLIKAIKNKDNKEWIKLFSTIVSSILGVILIFVYLLNFTKLSWNFLYYVILEIVASFIYLFILLLSIIIKIIQTKKLAKNNIEIKKVENKTKLIFLSFLIIISMSILCIGIDFTTYKIEQRNDRIAENKAKEQIIILLNQKYGDGDFEIIETVETNICYSCSWYGRGVDGYKFTMSTNYLDDDFIVSLTKEDLEIYENNFLNEYYKENLEIIDLESYLKNYKVQKLNKILSQNFNAEIDFDDIFMKDYSDKNYGQIPSIDELSSFVELYDPKFEIKEDLKTKEELLNYLVKLSKFYIKDFDTSNITYSQTSKYFRYKYDYTKLGVNNYTDQYNDYSGYVSAGNYKYSEEQGHYIVEDENTIVKINIIGTVTTFNIDDILKD